MLLSSWPKTNFNSFYFYIVILIFSDHTGSYITNRRYKWYHTTFKDRSRIWNWKLHPFYCFMDCDWLQHLATSCSFHEKWTVSCYSCSSAAVQCSCEHHITWCLLHGSLSHSGSAVVIVICCLMRNHVMFCCPAPLPDATNRRPHYNSGSAADATLPRWVTGELPAPGVYHQVLEAATGYGNAALLTNFFNSYTNWLLTRRSSVVIESVMMNVLLWSLFY